MFQTGITRLLVVVAIVAVLIGCYAFDALSHCHNTSDCENPGDHLLSRQRWDEDDRNTVKFLVNPDRYANTLPSLFPDVTTAAARWSRLTYQDGDDEDDWVEIDFKLEYEDDTYHSPGHEDQRSIVGYGYLGDEDDDEAPVAKVFRWTHNGRPEHIVEQDMVLNYYYDFAPHSDQSDDDKYCLLQILVHEFGHWVRFKDLPDNTCYEYNNHYVMYADSAPGIHNKEDVSCEEIWGVWWTYHVMGWPY